MSLNLFGLTSNPSKRIVRFKLSEGVQDELTTLLGDQETAFENSIEEEVPFDGKYKPELNEVLSISEYDDIDNLKNAIQNPLSIDEVEATTDEFESIKSLFSGYIDAEGNSTVLIQYFDKRKIISTNGLSIFHSADVYKRVEGLGITLDSKLSAILKNNKLRFFSFHILRQIFDLSAYYKEATDTDITSFAAMPMISVNNNDTLIALSDTWVRRKFALIAQSGILTSVPMHDIRAVAVEFSIPLTIEQKNGKDAIKIPDQKSELKQLLRFLDEDYYKSPLSHSFCLTNSKRMLS